MATGNCSRDQARLGVPAPGALTSPGVSSLPMCSVHTRVRAHGDTRGTSGAFACVPGRWQRARAAHTSTCEWPCACVRAGGARSCCLGAREAPSCRAGPGARGWRRRPGRGRLGPLCSCKAALCGAGPQAAGRAGNGARGGWRRTAPHPPAVPHTLCPAGMCPAGMCAPQGCVRPMGMCV